MKQTCMDSSELELEVESEEQRCDYFQLAWRRGRQRRAMKRKLTMLSVMFAPYVCSEFRVGLLSQTFPVRAPFVVVGVAKAQEGYIYIKQQIGCSQNWVRRIGRR